MASSIFVGKRALFLGRPEVEQPCMLWLKNGGKTFKTLTEYCTAVLEAENAGKERPLFFFGGSGNDKRLKAARESASVELYALSCDYVYNAVERKALPNLSDYVIELLESSDSESQNVTTSNLGAKPLLRSQNTAIYHTIQEKSENKTETPAQQFGSDSIFIMQDPATQSNSKKRKHQDEQLLLTQDDSDIDFTPSIEEIMPTSVLWENATPTFVMKPKKSVLARLERELCGNEVIAKRMLQLNKQINSGQLVKSEEKNEHAKLVQEIERHRWLSTDDAIVERIIQLSTQLNELDSQLSKTRGDMTVLRNNLIFEKEKELLEEQKLVMIKLDIFQRNLGRVASSERAEYLQFHDENLE